MDDLKHIFLTITTKCYVHAHMKQELETCITVCMYVCVCVCVQGPFINYVTQKGGGGISQCDDVYIKHTSV